MEEMDELRAIARAQAWQEAGPPYWDMTMFVPTSVSVLRASYLAAAMQARQAGSEYDARQREADADAVRAAWLCQPELAPLLYFHLAPPGAGRVRVVAF
jgi:hypothetical protein